MVLGSTHTFLKVRLLVAANVVQVPAQVFPCMRARMGLLLTSLEEVFGERLSEGTRSVVKGSGKVGKSGTIDRLRLKDPSMVKPSLLHSYLKEVPVHE